MREKRELQIENKIFTITNLADLIRLFVNQSNEIGNISREIKRQELVRKGLPELIISEGYIISGHVDIVLISSDNSKYNFSSEEFEEAIEILNSKKITGVELNFSEKISETRFVIKLSQSDSLSDSGYVFLEGKDKSWINVSMKRVEDFLISCKNQSVFIRKFKIPLIIGIIAILSFFLLNLIEFFIKTEVSFPKLVGNIFRDDLIYYIILFVMVTATPSVLIYRWLRKLYPVIELQTGPDSGKLLRERRNKLIIMTLAIIVPVVISVLLK